MPAYLNRVNDLSVVLHELGWVSFWLFVCEGLGGPIDTHWNVDEVAYALTYGSHMT